MPLLILGLLFVGGCSYTYTSSRASRSAYESGGYDYQESGTCSSDAEVMAKVDAAKSSFCGSAGSFVETFRTPEKFQCGTWGNYSFHFKGYCR
jgi:hypothetical protein